MVDFINAKLHFSCSLSVIHYMSESMWTPSSECCPSPTTTMYLQKSCPMPHVSITMWFFPSLSRDLWPLGWTETLTRTHHQLSSLNVSKKKKKICQKSTLRGRFRLARVWRVRTRGHVVCVYMWSSIRRVNPPGSVFVLCLSQIDDRHLKFLSPPLRRIKFIFLRYSPKM